MRKTLAVLGCALAVLAAPAAANAPDPAYDHQTKTYDANFEPVSASQTMSVTPFFSPDHSIDTIVSLIESVSQGGTIDIATPGFSSWSNCTGFDEQCVGCTIAGQAAEQFPVFPALLNAVHQKQATVRILTNNYDTATCAGKIAPLDYLSLNGVQIHFYTTTTFMHAKYVRVDGVTSISSINFSFTSFMENREAGVLLKAGTEDMQKLASDVFEFDFNQGPAYVVGNTYSSAQMSQITTSSKYTVTIPPPKVFPGSYVTPTPTAVSADAKATLFASPDNARKQVMADINSATSDFAIMVYQITDQVLCEGLEQLHHNGINVTILVSSYIYSKNDSALAYACYGDLHQAGLTIRRTPRYYTYSHQKFWIVDNTRMGMSTGNWSPTDYPDASVFPPYSSPSWVKANRDFNFQSDAPGVVKQYQDVLNNDYSRGYTWVPRHWDDDKPM